MYQKHKIVFIFLSTCCLLIFFFLFLFKFDNKYTTPPPYGQDGILVLSEEDFVRKTPVYLIDGWLLTDSTTSQQETYIGEFSNLQRGDLKKSPHGKATYELNLKYTGTPKIISIEFPELFSNYVIYLNGNQIIKGKGSARILFYLQNGNNLLTVKTSSYMGYYSGMYYPGKLGNEATILGVERINTLFYSVSMFCTLILICFTLQQWRHKKNHQPTYWLAILCICFAFYSSHYFVQLFSLPFKPIWYYVEDLSLYCLVFCMIRLTLSITNFLHTKPAKISIAMSIILPIVMIILQSMIPYWTYAVWLHGQIKSLYFILTFIWQLGISILYISYRQWEYPYIIAANLIFGTGLLINVFQSNIFEPIYSLWQFEWCGIFLVWLFAFMIVARNRRTLLENKEFTVHLENIMEQHTEEISCVINERHALFSDMAHDLKSPLAATKTFIDAIKNLDVDTNEKLDYYLDQLDNKQSEMSKRVQSLNTLNAMDKIGGKKEWLSIKCILQEVYDTYNAETEVGAVHLNIYPSSRDSFVFIQLEKILLVFENLIFNALQATPQGGSITITAINTDNTVTITIDDTGHGIAEAELPFIFKRFYVGERNKATGSGLGLYIVKAILEEADGKISATSQIGCGTRFLLEIPRRQ